MPFFLKARLNRLVKGVPQGYGLYLVINRKVCCMDRIYYIYMLYIWYMYWMYMDIIWYHAYFCSTVLFLSRTRRFTCIYRYIDIPHWYHSWPFGTDGVKWMLYYILQWRNSWSVEQSKLLLNHVLNIWVWCQTSLDERSPAHVWLL